MILVTLCVMYILRMHYIAHNRAIRPCHPSHSVPLALILPRGDQRYFLQKLLIRRDKGKTLYLLGLSALKSWVPCASPPASFLLSMGRQLLNQPFLVYVFSTFYPNLLRFPHRVYNFCAVSCASAPLLCCPRSRPRSRLRSYPRPRTHLRYCSRFRPRSRLHSHPVFVHGSPPPSPFSFCSVPVPATVPVPCVCVHLLNCT